MNYGEFAGQSLGNSGTGIGTEKPAPGITRLLSTWPVQERLADL